jgi:hypothetical protein
MSNLGMVASLESTAPDVSPTTALSVAPAPAAAPRVDQAALDAAQVRAERKLVHSVLTGMAIGAVVCCAIWVGLVAIATIGAGVRLLPLFAMAAGCGIFAGVFLGGSAGALAGSRGLEHVEHERMHGHN